MKDTYPLDIRHFGAVCNGTTDDIGAINKACEAGRDEGLPVLIPHGQTAYGAPIEADSVVIIGEGETSVLVMLDPMQATIFLRGSDAGVSRLRLAGGAGSVRGTTYECNRITALAAINFGVRDVHIDASAGAGIFCGQSSEAGHVEHCTIRGTLADAVHLTDRSNYITVENNRIFDAGDDGIAVVSYRDQATMVHHITARNNSISFNAGGRMMSVVGGESILYENNQLVGNVHSAGLYIAQEQAWNTYGAHNVLFRYNLLRAAGNTEKDHPAALIFSDGQEACTGITLARNIIMNTALPTGGVRVYGDCNGILIDANLVIADPALRIDADGVLVHPYFIGPVGVHA